MTKFLSLLLFSQLAFAAKEYAHHPPARDPLYLKPAFYEGLPAKLGQVPADPSAKLFEDYGELFYWQERRTPAECEEARSEVLVTLDNFYGAKSGILSAAEVEAFTPLFAQLRNDADFFIMKLKNEFKRPRPFNYIKGIEPCIPLEPSLAYPSGHTTLAHLYALVLADVFPAKKSKLLARAHIVATHRVLAGVHHRSDIASGEKLGEMLYTQISKNPQFKKDLRALKEKKL